MRPSLFVKHHTSEVILFRLWIYHAENLAASRQQSLKIGAAFVQQGQICEHYYTYTERSLSLKIDGKFKI